DLVVVAEVPGVTEEGITTDVEAGTLRLNAQGLQRQYRKVINLPADVETIPLATSYKNGILECKFTKLTAELRG
ncbi:MAG: Hsp20/alpha crystallin family protein, partial [Clostridia bacterium]|nr:Hsp20/alpha crystallin family protein [Clostridia bacterium]